MAGTKPSDSPPPPNDPVPAYNPPNTVLSDSACKLALETIRTEYRDRRKAAEEVAKMFNDYRSLFDKELALKRAGSRAMDDKVWLKSLRDKLNEKKSLYNYTECAEGQKPLLKLREEKVLNKAWLDLSSGGEAYNRSGMPECDSYCERHRGDTEIKLTNDQLIESAVAEIPKEPTDDYNCAYTASLRGAVDPVCVGKSSTDVEFFSSAVVSTDATRPKPPSYSHFLKILDRTVKMDVSAGYGTFKSNCKKALTKNFRGIPITLLTQDEQTDPFVQSCYIDRRNGKDQEACFSLGLNKLDSRGKITPEDVLKENKQDLFADANETHYLKAKLSGAGCDGSLAESPTAASAVTDQKSKTPTQDASGPAAVDATGAGSGH